ncbi:MAG TPA: PDZ domain-containing protein [Pirellulales bacterium]|nr:PDZ domain-containing protein [Pirellulales bacterium]
MRPRILAAGARGAALITGFAIVAFGACATSFAQVSPQAVAPSAAGSMTNDHVRPGAQPEVPKGPPGSVDPKISDSLWRQLGLRLESTAASNIFVADVRPQSPAAKAGLAKGDELISIAQAPVSTRERAERDLLGALTSDSVTMALRRTGTRYDTTLEVTRTPGSPGLGDATGPTATDINVFGMFVHEQGQRAVVTVVSPLSPAAKAGVMPGDILLSVGGHAAAPVSALVPFAAEMVNRKQRGAPVTVELLRNGQPLAVQVFGSDQSAVAGVGVAEGDSPVDQEITAATSGMLGLVLRDVSPNTVHVARVAPNSPAAKAGIVAGDVLVALDRNSLSTTQQFVSIVGMYELGDEVPLVVNHQGRALNVMMRLTPRLQDAAQSSVGISTTMMRDEIRQLEMRIQALSDEIQLVEKQQAAARASTPATVSQSAPAQVK